MRNNRILLLACAAVAMLLFALPARAEEVSLLSPSRLSVGARAYRSFDEVAGEAGGYSSAWWAGLPMAWEITSPKDPTVRFPISVIGAIDIRIPDGDNKQSIRGYVGVGMLLKKGGS